MKRLFSFWLIFGLARAIDDHSPNIIEDLFEDDRPELELGKLTILNSSISFLICLRKWKIVKFVILVLLIFSNCESTCDLT